MNTTPPRLSPEDRRSPSLPSALAASASSFAVSYRLVFAEVEADFAVLVDKAMEAVRSAVEREDAVFGAFNGLRSTLQSITYHEGRLLEWGLLRLARCNPDLIVLPQNRPMPIVPAALEILARNEWHKLHGITLNAQVHAAASYTPDLLIVHQPRQSLLITDVKRSLASTEGRRLDGLLKRMMAAGLTAASWVYAEYRGMLISEVRIAVLDGSNEVTADTDGVFPMVALDTLLHLEGAGAAMEKLRAMFAQRVQAELAVLCRALVQSLDDVRALGGDDAAAGFSPDGPGLAGTAADQQAGIDEEAECPHCGQNEPGLQVYERQSSDGTAASAGLSDPAPDPVFASIATAPVKVGLARVAMH
jgi:hypothetical protein